MAIKTKLTKRIIEQTPVPATGRLELKDTDMPGLVLRIKPTGARTLSLPKTPSAPMMRCQGPNRVILSSHAGNNPTAMALAGFADQVTAPD